MNICRQKTNSIYVRAPKRTHKSKNISIIPQMAFLPRCGRITKLVGKTMQCRGKLI
jgi:hypothetical protein